MKRRLKATVAYAAEVIRRGDLVRLDNSRARTVIAISGPGAIANRVFFCDSQVQANTMSRWLARCSISHTRMTHKTFGMLVQSENEHH